MKTASSAIGTCAAGEGTFACSARAWWSALAVAGLLSAAPMAFAQQDQPVTGAAAGGAATGTNDTLEKCNKTLGVLRIQEDTASSWYRYYGPRLGSTSPLLSMLILQSNCFVVVERGTGERDLTDETRRARGDEARESGTRGKGQQVVADYLLKPEIVMANKDNQGSNFGGLSGLGGVLGKLSAAAGSVSMKSSEVGTVLTLVDIRSTIRLAAAEGYSKNTSYGVRGFGIGGAGALGGSAYANTDEGKLVSAAFFDAYNKLVVALRQYKAQHVEGGMGEGGGLGVQGGSTAASKKLGK